jgi:hypothetical protein
MTWESIFIGVLAIAVGLAWVFYGLKLFIILLPIWAFFVGLISGASWADTFLGESFLGTITSWAIGIGLGLLLAILSYFFYYAAVALLGGTVGYTLGAGLMAALGADPSGFLAIVVGLICGVVLAAATILLAVPVWLVIWITAIGGAVAAVNGVLILLGQIPVAAINFGLAQGLWTNGAIGIIAAIVLAAIGIFWQTRDTAETVVAVERERYRYA